MLLNSIAHYTEKSDYSSMVSEVCLNSSGVQGSVFILFLDADGKWISQMNDNPSICTDISNAYSTLDTSQTVRVEALVTSQDGTRYSSQADIFFFSKKQIFKLVQLFLYIPTQI